MPVYGPFSPFQQLVAVHFPGKTGPFGGFLYYDITYTLTIIGNNPPLQDGLAQLASLAAPQNQITQGFSYGLGNVTLTLDLMRVKSGECILNLYDLSPNFAGLIDIANVGLGREAGFVGMWGSFVATGHFTNGTVTVKSPVSPTVGQSSIDATASDGTGGELYHGFRGAGLPQNSLHFSFPDDTTFGVQVLVSPNFGPPPSGDTSVLSFFSTDLAPPVLSSLITHTVA